MSDEP